MLKLTENQINYIIEFYGATKTIINDIERRLNLLGVIDNEDDYYEVVAEVAAQKQTISEQIKKCSTREEAMRKWVSTDSLIKHALNEKYNNFLNANSEVQQKIRNYC